MLSNGSLFRLMTDGCLKLLIKEIINLTKEEFTYLLMIRTLGNWR